MSQQSRIVRLEKARRARKTPLSMPRTDEEWLQQFEYWGKAGEFAEESEYPAALKTFAETMYSAGNTAAYSTRSAANQAAFEALLDMALRVAQKQRADNPDEDAHEESESAH